MEHHKKTISNSSAVLIGLGVALIILALYNASQITTLKNLIGEKITEVTVASRTAKVQLTTISAACDDCYDINSVVKVIESTDVNITDKKEIDFSSKEAKSLIEKYGIEKLPTVIVTGEINRSKSLTNKFKSIGEEKEGAFVFTNLEPPYVDAKSGEVKGKIFLIHLKAKACTECADLSSFISQLKESGLIIENEVVLDIDSDEGKKLIKDYNIEKVPIIIMDQEAGVYSNIKERWAQTGTVESDGYHIMRQILPPYYSIKERKTKGLVSMTILSDNNCEECYDGEEFHKQILQRLGIIFSDEKSLDISSTEGQALVERYKIEAVPVLILTGDMEEYPVLVQAWPSVGTVEEDGTYIFRKVEIARKPYKDLTSNKVIDPNKPAETSVTAAAEA